MCGKGRIAASARWLAGGVGLLFTVGALVFPAGASAALAGHPFLGSFCEPSGVEEAPCEPSFGVPAGMAVDPGSGDLFVIDLEDQTLHRFKPNGEPDPFSALAGNAIDGHAGEEDEVPGIEEILSTEGSGAEGTPEAQVAVAPPGSAGGTAGDIYVTDGENGFVDVFAPSGNYLGQVGAGFPCGVAVDPGGALYVGDYEFGVHKLVPTAPGSFGPPANFALAQTCQLAAGAGASAGFVFATVFRGPVWKIFSEGPEEGKKQYSIGGENRAVAVDTESGHLYIASESRVTEYDASGASEAKALSEIDPGGEKVAGLVVPAGGSKVFIARIGKAQVEVWGPAEVLPEPITEEASPVGAESATLRGKVNPKGQALLPDPDGCFFEWGETKSYGQIAPCEEPDAEEVGSGISPVAVHAGISGLEPGTTYHVQLAAANVNGQAEGGDIAFRTLGASIKSEKASQIGATGARLSAEVNPNGEETSYAFEYVSEAQFEESKYAEAVSLPEPPEAIGAGSGFLAVGQQLIGLEPETTYHFRILASSSGAEHFGPDLTFTTFGFATAPLDGRTYELVSPAQKIGEVFPPEPLGIWSGSCGNCLPGIPDEHMPMQATSDGEAVVYEGQPFTANLAAGPNQYRGRRSASGWSSQSLSTPLFGSLEGQGYKAFSADLGRAVLYQVEPALSPEAPVRGGISFPNLYLRDENGALQPLVTEEPPKRDPNFQSPNVFKVNFTGADAGTGLVGPLSHVSFEANDALTEEAPGTAPAAPLVAANERNLYEWVNGELRLVNVAPDNATALAGTVFGSGRQLTGEVGGSGADFDGVVSEDGSRIFFSEKASGQVYVRIDGEETRKIEDPGRYLFASADGSRVLLSDGCLYEIEAEECEADLTLDESEVHQGGFEGILGSSEDLSRVYFVDTKALTPEGEENENGEHAEEGAFNLYGWEEGESSFIARLNGDDNRVSNVEPQVGDWLPSSSSRTAQASGDGGFLAFMSVAALTGYEHPAKFEVYEYRAEEEKLICASCNPSEQAPLGGANLSLISRNLSPLEPTTGFAQPGNLSEEEGRLFFESRDALTLGDTNGRIQDVYEWEPEGIGDCERAKGCIALISSGQSPNDSMFLNATPSGDDAFFITRERLVAPDKDEKLDLYDARVGGGFEELPAPPCGGEPCQGQGGSGPLSLQGPASNGFSGPGNLKPKKQKKGHHHKHHKKHRHKHKRGGSR